MCGAGWDGIRNQDWQRPRGGPNQTMGTTSTLPNGSTEAEVYHDAITGHKTVVTGTLDQGSGGVQSWTSVSIKHGPRTTISKTITEPDGTVKHQKTIIINRGALDSTSTTSTHIPARDSILFGSSASDVVRVQPPSS